MSLEMKVEEHFKYSYRAVVKAVAQQTKNPLMDAITVVQADGEAQSTADLLGEDPYVKSSPYDVEGPEVRAKDRRRWLVYPDYHIEWGRTLFKVEAFKKMQADPSAMAQRGVNAVNRGIFDAILGVSEVSAGNFKVTGRGIMGKTTEGKTPNSGVGSLPPSNYVAHNTEGLTLEKLRAATEAAELENFGLETEDPVYCLITPKQKTDLLNIAAATKLNLNQFDIDQIKTGKPTTLLGITWIFSNRVPKNNSGERLVPLWTKSNVVAGFWQRLEGVINNTGKRNLPYLLTSAIMDCTRHEDAGVRVIECKES